MRIITIITLILFIFSSCSSVKQANNALLKGNYIEAINTSVNRLQKNKAKKADYEQMAILEVAFQKLKASYNDRIDFLEKDVTKNTGEIYNMYLDLDEVQNMIKPLLPLRKQDGTYANFVFENYNNKIIEAKQEHITSLYTKGVKLMKGTKLDNRNAYNVFKELLALNPDYKDGSKLLDQARFNGTDFVYITIQNKTNQVIPRRLQDVLLDFNTYGMDDFWTEFHNTKQKNYNYNYEVVLEFKEFLISPERVAEKEIPLSKEIITTSTRLDRNGKPILDAEGKQIKDEIKSNVSGTLNQVMQTKSVAVTGQVHYFDLVRNQRTNTYPLQSTFVFENVFAQFKGDSRVLTDKELALTKNRAIAFPSNEQMLIDASNDIKGAFTTILKRYKLN